MDSAALKQTWKLAEEVGDQVPLFFYSHLFLSHPELRTMFPVSMATQRDRLVGALGRIVSKVDELEEVMAFIQQLGRDHRRFQVVAENYSAVGASLLATLKHFLGSEWTPDVASDWAEAYGLIATVMVQAAEESEAVSPDAWVAEVTAVDRRSLDVVVLQVQPEQALPFHPGQSVAVEIPERLRLWRYLSPANAPRPDGSLEFHVQIVPGGQVSGVIARAVKPGHRIRLGAAVGQELTLPDDNGYDLLMVAGGTGLAPMRALVEAIDRKWHATGTAPAVHLFHGVRLPWNLYEHAMLTALSQRPWFDYTPVVSEDPTYPGTKGLVGAAAAAAGDWTGRLAMACGSPAMVSHTVTQLRSVGVPDSTIRYEQFATLDEDSHLLHHQSESSDQC